MAGFCTDTEIKAMVSATLTKDSVDISGVVWDSIIPVANLSAYDQIRDHFIELGYTPADVASW